LTRELRKHFGALGEKLRHDELMRYSFSPPLEYHRLDVALELHRRRARARFLFVVFAALGRRVAFTPSLPELWFELDRDDLLSDRAPEVLTHYFRRLEHEDEEDFTQPEELSLAGTAWVSNLDLEIFPRQRINEEDTDRWLLGEAQPVSGEHELFRVGRCLDHLFPEELDRVILREHELAELTRLLNAPDRRWPKESIRLMFTGPSSGSVRSGWAGVRLGNGWKKILCVCYRCAVCTTRTAKPWTCALAWQVPSDPG
jgi:hypothetical protein